MRAKEVNLRVNIFRKYPPYKLLKYICTPILYRVYLRIYIAATAEKSHAIDAF